MTKATPLLLVALMAASLARGQEKTVAQYWAETGISFALLDEILTAEGCHASEPELHGCVEAVSAVLRSILPGRALVPDGDAVTGETERSFGPARIVRVTGETPRASSARALYAAAHAKQERSRAAWRRYLAGSARAPFMEIIAWLRARTPEARRPETAALAYNAYLGASRDPATHIAPKRLVDDESQRSRTTYSGTGTQFRVAGGTVFIRPMPGGPAHRAGVRNLDVLTHVDGDAVSGLAIDDVARRLRRPAGTVVRLGILRGGVARTIGVRCEEISIPLVESRLIETEPRARMGYVKLRHFSSEAACDGVESAVGELTTAGASGLILDLRANPGGRFNQALCVANVFLDRGSHVYSIRSFPGRNAHESDGYTSVVAKTALPLVVLIDAGTASVAELVAGAIQHHDRGLVVGTRSFGKGTAQSVFPWPKNPAIYLAETASYFLLAGGRSNQLDGIVTDLREVHEIPGADEDQRFALRQADVYFNPLALPTGVSTRFVQPRPEIAAHAQACVDRDGLAEGRFRKAQGGAVAPDFALLSAQDTLACSIAP